MKTLFITLFAIVSVCIAPSCLAQPVGGDGGLGGHAWGSGGIGGGMGIGGGSGGWGGAALGGGGGDSGWIGSGMGGGGGGSGPQVVSATWGAVVPGPAIRLLPASHGYINIGHGGHGGHGGHH